MAERKQYVKTGLATAAGLLLLAGVAYQQGLWREQKAESPHYRAEACGVCHFEFSGQSALKVAELTLCTSCHEREGVVVVRNAEGREVSVDLGQSHPWGLVPSAKSMPQTLPLVGGVITCQTCHDVHLSNTESHMLRLYKLQSGGDPDWTPLCTDCHVGY